MTSSDQRAFEARAALRNPALRAGLLTGGLLSFVMAMALIAANRITFLERFAQERNAISGAAFVIVALFPIARFRRAPSQLFVSGMLGWAVFTLAYLVEGFAFEDLFNVLRTPFVILIYGAAAYGMVAVAIWVGSMVLTARHHPIVHARRRASQSHR